MKYNVGVGVGVLVIKNGKFLIHLRHGAHGAHTWAPPGGRMDTGEKPSQTAIREVKEESDLEVKDVQFLTFTNDYFEDEDQHWITLWYTSFWVSGTAKIMEPDRNLEVRWVTLDELPDNVFLTVKNLQNDTAAIEKVNQLLNT